MFKRPFLVLLSLVILGSVGPLVAPSDAALVGWWKFDEGAGTTAMDSSGQGPDIPLVDIIWEPGVIGNAVNFQGTGYGSDTSFSFSDNAITVCTWVRHDAFVSGQVERYVTVGPEVAVLRRNSDDRLHFYITTGGAFSHLYVGDVLTEAQWHYVAGTWDGSTQRLYLDGVEIASATPSGTLAAGTMLRLSSPDGEYLNGALDDTRLYNQALSQDEIIGLMEATTPAEAGKPVPDNEATDVPREVVLGWKAGEYAATHDVYFGTGFDDVNDADRSNPRSVLVSESQADPAYDPDGLLDFGATYYWRVDEVNAAPDNAIYKGSVWSFTTEPFAYAIENVTATTNALYEAGAGPENTVNGSGLNADDQHSVASTDMFLGGPADGESVSLQYEFDGVYKLYQLLVWNYNVQFELILGFGIQNVTVEYSENGVDWASLGDVDLNQATAASTYTANTTIDLGGVAARYVKLTVNSGFGGTGQYGLSEVRFMYIPAQAREPEPADGAAGVDVTTLLTWRAGRDSITHDLAFGTDPDALALVGTVDTPSFDPGELDLGTTYYWQVTEIQETDSWTGPVWSFATQDYLVVDDLESYTDEEGSRIYEFWEDGYVNDTGSTVGYFEEPFTEQDIVHSGGQSMPLFYDNAGGAVSDADLALAQDWTTNGVQSLSLYFYGDTDNSAAQLYVKIGNTKVLYEGATVALTEASWHLWNIDLAATGANLNNVNQLTIGIEGVGSGVLYIDDIRLLPEVIGYSTLPDVTAPGDAVVGVPNDDDWPEGETPDLAIDNDTATKFLHFKGFSEPTGIQVTPAAGASIVTGVTFTTANDAPERDPVAFELYGSNGGIDGPYTLIASGDISDFAQEAAWPRFAKNETPITFDNSTAYSHYQLLFTAVRDPAVANSMQIAEIELLGSGAN